MLCIDGSCLGWCSQVGRSRSRSRDSEGIACSGQVAEHVSIADVGIGALTKELAKQAIGDGVKDVVDSLRPPDLASVAETIAGTKPAAPPAEASTGAILVGQLQAMQNALKDDQELLILCSTALGTLRVLEIFVPAWRVAVLTGIDTDKVITRAVGPVENLVLVCKPMPVQSGSKPV